MKNIKRKWLRIFVAKYITYLEILAYAFVAVVGTGIFLAFWIKVEDTVESKAGDLVFLEQEIKATSDTALLRLRAKDKTDVRKGDVLADVCDDPSWVARYRATLGLIESLKPLQARVTSGTATAEENTLCREMEARLAAWRNDMPPGVTEIRSPIDGLFWQGDAKEATIVAAGARLFGVKDLSVLQADLRCETGSLQYCRAGLKARIKFVPVNTYETLIRLNVKPGWFFSYQHQLSTVTGDGIRKYVEKELKKLPLQPKEDVALPLKTLQGIDIFTQADPLAGDASRPAVKPEFYRAEKHPAVVITGKHTGNIKLTKMSPDQEKYVEELLAKIMKKNAYAGEFGAYHVDDLKSMVVNILMTGELVEPDVDLKANPTGLYPDELPEINRDNESDFVFYNTRKFYFTARLVNPDEVLKQRVKELAKDGKALQVTAEIIVQRRRFAMLLFRSD